MINEHDIKDMWPTPNMELYRKHPPQTPAKPVANAKQVAGDHYKKYGDFQPWDAVIAWNLGYLEGTALKYIARWKDKNGIEDIKKAIHFLEKLVEVYDQK